MLDRLRALLAPDDTADPDGSGDASNPAEGTADVWDAVGRLTDAESPTEFSHELYVDTSALAAALADCSPSRALEVGCGYGRLTPWIADCATEHHAIDPVGPLLAAAATEFPDVGFCRARVEALPYPDDAVDLAVTWGVLNHVPSARIDDAAAELDRVVAPGGTLVVSEATDGTPDPRWEYRSIEEWCALFEPRRLVWHEHTDRDSESFGDPDREHVVMKFR